MANINIVKVNIVLAISFLALMITSQVISHIKSTPVIAITEKPLLPKNKKKVIMTANQQKRTVAAKLVKTTSKTEVKKISRQ